MVKQQSSKRWLMLIVLAAASLMITGCEKGSLGIKGGAATGYVIDAANNQPVSEVLVRATVPTAGGNSSQTKTTYTAGDGSFTFKDMVTGNWTFEIEKYGYELTEDDPNAPAATAYVNTGESVKVPVIKIVRTSQLYRGVLKGYPVDAITGRPLRNFTVTQTYPYNQRRNKLFESANDFKDMGWTGLEGGEHHYTITATNYRAFDTEEVYADPIEIGPSPVDLGVIHMQPHRVSISGTLRNLPGYVLNTGDRDIYIWAEASGRVVASFTDSGDADALKGSINYQLSNIPVTANSVSVRAKIRGYDTITINPAVSIAQNMPGGTIAGIDANFANIDPIKRDVRVIVLGTAPDDDCPGSFAPGDVARVYIKQGGRDIVPYVDVVSVNYRAEAYFSGVITGYPLQFIAVNQNRGFFSTETQEEIIDEDGNTIYSIRLTLGD